MNTLIAILIVALIIVEILNIIENRNTCSWNKRAREDYVNELQAKLAESERNLATARALLADRYETDKMAFIITPEQNYLCPKDWRERLK
jgi:predicted house-cleaning noncanonical NTP pyrophosphatase (MazG superfamily)